VYLAGLTFSHAFGHLSGAFHIAVALFLRIQVILVDDNYQWLLISQIQAGLLNTSFIICLSGLRIIVCGGWSI
jgi:hypothetical protein